MNLEEGNDGHLLRYVLNLYNEEDWVVMAYIGDYPVVELGEVPFFRPLATSSDRVAQRFVDGFVGIRFDPMPSGVELVEAELAIGVPVHWAVYVQDPRSGYVPLLSEMRDGSKGSLSPGIIPKEYSQALRESTAAPQTDGNRAPSLDARDEAGAGEQEVFWIKRILELEELEDWLALGYIGTFQVDTGGFVACFKVIGGSSQVMIDRYSPFICMRRYDQDVLSREVFDIDLLHQAVSLWTMQDDPRTVQSLSKDNMRGARRGHFMPGYAPTEED